MVFRRQHFTFFILPQWQNVLFHIIYDNITQIHSLLLLHNNQNRTLTAWFISLMSFIFICIPIISSAQSSFDISNIIFFVYYTLLYVLCALISLYIIMGIYKFLKKKLIFEKLFANETKLNILLMIIKAVIACVIWNIIYGFNIFKIPAYIIVTLICSVLLIRKTYIKTLFAWFISAGFLTLVIAPLKFILPEVLDKIKLDYYLFLSIVNYLTFYASLTLLCVSGFTIIRYIYLHNKNRIN